MHRVLVEEDFFSRAGMISSSSTLIEELYISMGWLVLSAPIPPVLLVRYGFSP
jgi:hypothetical protein